MTPPARILRDLIRIRSDTGSDMEPVVGYAADFLKRRGLDVHLFNFGGGAPCMVARLPGRTRGVPRPLLALYCHLDTAAFDASGWRTDSLGAAVLRGRIFGRGAVDCKGLAAVWMSLLAGRASGGPDLPFDTALVAVTDEEVQGNAGLEALLDRTAELEGAFLALSEGGGFPLNACGRRYYTVQTGEMDELAPGMDGRPLRPPAFPAALAAGFRLGAFTAETLGYRVRVFLGGGGERRLAHPPFAFQIAEESRIFRAPLIPAGLGRGAEAGLIEAGRPGGSPGGLDAIRRALRECDPGARILPLITVGRSDNRHFRRRGIPTIGFFPLAPEVPVAGIHGADEHISIASLELASRVLGRVVMGLSVPKPRFRC